LLVATCALQARCSSAQAARDLKSQILQSFGASGSGALSASDEAGLVLNPTDQDLDEIDPRRWFVRVAAGPLKAGSG